MRPDPRRARTRMVERQLRDRGITDARVLDAMSAVPREAFVLPDDAARAYDDRALSLGRGQTISQPYIVAAMCQLLGLSGDERVLEIGGGSGYAAAVLDELADEVVTVERIPELAAAARVALDATGHVGVEVRVGDGSLGAPDRAPFDAIVVSAAVPTLADALVSQLTVGGRLVAPVGDRSSQHLELVERRESGTVRSTGLPCRFVPLLGVGGFEG